MEKAEHFYEEYEKINSLFVVCPVVMWISSSPACNTRITMDLRQLLNRMICRLSVP